MYEVESQYQERIGNCRILVSIQYIVCIYCIHRCIRLVSRERPKRPKSETPPRAPVHPLDLQYGISNLYAQIPNPQSQISNLNPQISQISQISTTRHGNVLLDYCSNLNSQIRNRNYQARSSLDSLLYSMIRLPVL